MDDKKRTNNPPAGMAQHDTTPESRKTYAFDPHIDPTLDWAGKAEGVAFEVQSSSIHNDFEVVLEMKNLISAEEKKRIQELLATHPFTRYMVAEKVAKGMAEGRAEGVRNIICRFLETKYGADSVQLQEEIQKITDLDVLDEIAGKLFVAFSLEEMQKIINGE